MEFLNPTAFWGMTVLLAPTIVLLLSKKKQQIVNFPSLIFLAESESKSARYIFPTEWLLWFLRVAILSLFVLMLAKPIFPTASQSKKVYIEKEVYEDQSFATVLSSLGAEVKVVEPKSLWLLVQKLNSSSDSSVVYTRNFSKHFKGKNVELGSHIEWRIVPKEVEVIIVDSFEVDKEKIEVESRFGEKGLKWTASKTNSEVGNNSETIKLKISNAKSREDAKEKLTSILNAFSSVLPLKFEIGEGIVDWQISIDTLVDQSDAKLIQWDFSQEPLRLDRLSDDFFMMSGDLASQYLEKSDFALQLAQVFMSNRLNLDSLDQRLGPIPIVSSEVISQAAVFKSERKFYWWSIILVLILIERWYSRKLASE